MCQTRFSSLGTFAVEARLARTVDFDSIIELFASRKARKAPVLWSPYVIGQAIHYIFALWFLLSSSFFFFSSPNLSRRRLDVYHTCTHGMALVRI